MSLEPRNWLWDETHDNTSRLTSYNTSRYGIWGSECIPWLTKKANTFGMEWTNFFLALGWIDPFDETLLRVQKNSTIRHQRIRRVKKSNNVNVILRLCLVVELRRTSSYQYQYSSSSPSSSFIPNGLLVSSLKNLISCDCGQCFNGQLMIIRFP